jgi:hypothetical protein
MVGLRIVGVGIRCAGAPNAHEYITDDLLPVTDDLLPDLQPKFSLKNSSFLTVINCVRKSLKNHITENKKEGG